MSIIYHRYFSFLFLGLVILTPIVGLSQTRSFSRDALQEAFLIERRGNAEEARRIYETVLLSDPTNRRAYQQLKNILRRQKDYEATLQLLQRWLANVPGDLSAQIEVGEIYYLSQKEDMAREVWKGIEERTGSGARIYHLLAQTYSRLGLTDDLESLVQRGRERFHQAAFMAAELGNYYYLRRTYDRALEEYLLLLLFQPQQKQFVQNRLLLMSDEEESQSIIEQQLLENLHKQERTFRELLSAFYFKTGQYHKALVQNRQLGFSSSTDQQRWLRFANNLRLEGQFDLAIKAYQDLLSQPLKQSNTIGKALLGLAKTYEDQIIVPSGETPLVAFYPDNIFFENPFLERANISRASLETTFALYDSILTRFPRTSFSPQAHFRLGEILFRVNQDFDGARRSFLAALAAEPGSRLREQINLRLGDLYITRGDLQLARTYFTSSVPTNNGHLTPFVMKTILVELLSGDMPTAQTLIDSLVKVSPSDDLYFNDLLELQDLLATYYKPDQPQDSTAFQMFFRSELLLRQAKVTEAAEVLAFIRQQTPQAAIIPLVTFLEATLRLSRHQLELAEQLAETLLSTPWADQGLVLLGEITERRGENLQEARRYYHRLLKEYPNSMLAEPVRLHLRELNAKLEG
jgi:tetratricopeptide (TPR) repeat protein